MLAYFARRSNRQDVSVGRRVVAPVLATLALGAALWVTSDQMAVLLGVDPASPLRWQLPAIFAVAAVAGRGGGVRGAGDGGVGRLLGG